MHLAKKKKTSQLPFRLNIVFFIIFLLFSLLIVQLGVVQILHGESFQDEIDRTIQDTTKIPVPRGKIMDRNHNLIVDNKSLYSITYTPPKGVEAKDKLKIATDLAKYISMDSEKDIKGITLRNKKEYWYLINKEEADSRLSDEEKEELDNVEQYDKILERITEEDIADFTEEELEIIAIKRELDKAYSLTPQIIKSGNVTPEEYAQVAEHLDELPGVNATTDWDREYLYGDTFGTFLGAITSQEQGILADKEQYYLTRGYSRNDRVGRSGLEEQYETLLRGRKEQIQYTTNKNGLVIDSEKIVEGERGKDLVLTVDMEFQERVDEIVRKELETTIKKNPSQNKYLEDALVVVMNPRTGDLLAVSGQHYDRKKDKFENAAFKTLYDAHRPGSTVKGATVLAGYESGVISPYQTFVDRPIKIAGTETKGSYTTLGLVNDIDALERSSNVYMFYIALKMGGEHRYPFPDGSSATFNSQGLVDMRNYFGQFGLGVKTGIDMPYEATGFVGKNPQAGNFMDFAIGQYDTYTTLQLAQYVSTIANDGYRVKPRIVKEIREPVPHEDELGPIYRSNDVKVLNRLEMDETLIKRVQEGFRRGFQGSRGTGRAFWANKDYNPAGKTGTAEEEIYHDGKKIANVENHLLVGYAPFDDPEVAFAVIVPSLGTKNQHRINHTIGAGVLDTYFELKKEREQNDED